MYLKIRLISKVLIDLFHIFFRSSPSVSFLKLEYTWSRDTRQPHDPASVTTKAAISFRRSNVKELQECLKKRGIYLLSTFRSLN